MQVKAFEVNAVDYLLKPFDKKRVAQAVQKARLQQETESLPADKIDTLMRMLQGAQNPEYEDSAQGSGANVSGGSTGDLLRLDRRRSYYSSHAGPSGMEGHSNCRTLEETTLSSLDAGLFGGLTAAYLVNINRNSRSRSLFKSAVPVAHGR